MSDPELLGGRVSSAGNQYQNIHIIEGAKAQLGNTYHFGLENSLNILPYATNAPFNSYNRQHQPICLPDTRVDLLKEIYDWASRRDERCIFWLHGIAGTGKSTIARTVARYYFNEKRLGASFFFSRGDGDVSHADKFVTSVARQLAESIPGLDQHIRDVLKKRSDITSRSLHDQWHELIFCPLSKLNHNASSSSYILTIDALDECADKKNVQVLLRLFSEARSLLNVRLRIFLTSRLEPLIREGFSQMPSSHYQDFVLHDIPLSTVDHDIYLFLEDNLRAIGQRQYLDDIWPGETIINRLVEIANGLFIWAATACRFISEGKLFAPKRLDMILQERQSARTAPEKQLDEIYNTVLRQTIPSEYTDDEKEEWYSLLRQILGSIVTLLSPLRISSLNVLIRIPKKDIKQILDGLHSILVIPQDQNQPLRLHHPSFRDFLLNKERCTDKNLQVDERETHHTLANQCIEIMSKSIKQDICGLDGLGMSVKDFYESRVQLNLPHEVQYACLYWVQHLEKSEVKLSDDNQVHKFLQEHLLHWLEALSWMRKVSEAIYAVTALRSITLAGDCPRLSAFIHDAWRFVLYSRSGFEKDPLQLYSSALLFAPEKSIVRRKFIDQVPRWIGRLPNVREDWSALYQTLEGHNSIFPQMSFSSDSKLLALATEDGSVRLWDAATGVERLSFQLNGDDVEAISFSPDSKTLALGTSFGIVRLCDAATGLERHSLGGHWGSVGIIAFSSDGKLIASGSSDETVKLWDVTTGTELYTLKGHSDPVSAIIFLPGDKLLASASKNKLVVKLWDVTTGIESQTREVFDHSSDSVTFSSDGKLLATRSDPLVSVRDVNTGDGLRDINKEDGLKWSQEPEAFRCIAISPDSKILASGSHTTVTMWHIASGVKQQKFEGHKSWVRVVVFSPDGKMLASASSDRTIKLWEALIETRREISNDDHKGWVNGITFSPDGKLLASASHDNTVRLWDAVLGVRKKMLGRHDAWINDMAFSPDSKLLATAGDKSVKLWDVVGNEEQRKFEGHEEWVDSIAFSPDGNLLASISINKTIKLWDVVTGAEQQTIMGGELRLESPLSYSLIWGERTSAIFVNKSNVDVLSFWIDMKGISKHYDIMEPGKQYSMTTFVGHFWRFINSDTNKTIGGFCGTPEHAEVIINDEDVMAVEGNKQYLQSAIKRLNLWSTTSDAPRKESRSSLAVHDNWITDDSKKRLIWLPDEYRPTCYATKLNTLVLGHASGGVTFVEINPSAMPSILH